MLEKAIASAQEDYATSQLMIQNLKDNIGIAVAAHEAQQRRVAEVSSL